MGVVYEDLYDHEGYASGRSTQDRSAEPGHRTAVDVYEAACSCGWTGSCDYPLTEEGRELATLEWANEHALPLLELVVPVSVAVALEEAERAVRDLPGRRPRAARELVDRHARWVNGIQRQLQSEEAARRLLDTATTRHSRGAGR